MLESVPETNLYILTPVDDISFYLIIMGVVLTKYVHFDKCGNYEFALN